MNNIKVTSTRQTKYTQRLLARIIIQAETPLAVSSGKEDFMSNKLIIHDVNGLPYIPGTGIAGVIRHAMNEADAEKYFGYQNHNNEGEGSKIIFTSAQIVGEDGMPIDGMRIIDFDKSDFYSHFKNLPIRQHVRISNTGTAERKGKFDEQIVFKGTRFCFEIEQFATTEDIVKHSTEQINAIEKVKCTNVFLNIIRVLNSSHFRIGGGTRSGFGKMKVVDCKYCILDLNSNDDLKAYLTKSSDLSNDAFWKSNSRVSYVTDKQLSTTEWTAYRFKLKPDDFYLFGIGYGDEEADIIPVRESIIIWPDQNLPQFQHENILIPASSIKGAISHRTAFYYNKINRFYIDADNEAKKPLYGKENVAVKALFGSEGKMNDSNEMIDEQCGNVIFSDIIEAVDQEEKKIFNHVSIDRFSGGTIDGALFSEKSIYACNSEYSLEILVKSEVLEKKAIKDSFEAALSDLCTGMLPLGGGVNRGNGFFHGIKSELSE